MKKNKENKNILFLAKLYYPHIGGVEKHVAQISEILNKKGYKVTVVCEQHDKKLKLKEQINGIDIIRIPINSSERKKKFHIWKWMIKKRNFIKSFDIVHIHDIFYWIFPLLVYLDRKKIFITFHGYESYPLNIKQVIQRKIAEKISAGNICVGDFMKKWYYTKPTKVIYGACDTPKRTKIAKKSNKTLLFYGRLDDQTGIKEYYKAYLRLKKEYKSLSMKVIGEGKYKNELKSLSIFKFKNNIQKDIEEARFVLVSRYLSMLEAMVNKRLVFAIYDNPIKRDYLQMSPFKNTAIVCFSADELYEKIKFYIDNPSQEKKQIDKAYKFAKKLTWEKLVTDYLKLWKNII